MLGEVQKVLPNGWHAAITPDVPEKVACEFRQPDATGLMIWRDDKAVGKYVGLRLPPGSLDAEDQPQRVFFQMVLMECLTPEQYQQAAEKNVQNDRQRRELQEQADRRRDQKLCGVSRESGRGSPAAVDL